MPFGASLTATGETLFSLWAPGARQVDVRLFSDKSERLLPMEAKAEGWFSQLVPGACAGQRYMYVIDGDRSVPDPASRHQPDGVHGPSEVVDPAGFEWSDGEWHGRPWEEAIFYELHVGAFTPEGTFASARDKLNDLVGLGVTAIELMPLAESPGARNWGYDGVYPFAPESRYGSPDDLKVLIDEAHRCNLMVFVDVVYNHFGPEGNYLALYAPPFFTDRRRTPWGAAIAFDDPEVRAVRDFFVHNALYWIDEFNVDGLRLDAVHAIYDDSDRHILAEIADAVRQQPRRPNIHLVLENDDNQAQLLERDGAGRPVRYAAQWNDDLHHALHVLVTGETRGYYGDYANDPAGHLGRALAEGFAFQGEPSPHRGGRRRGTPSGTLPPSAFVSFLQNHDQIGNRARGDRIVTIAPRDAVKAATAIVLLSPAPPLIFMGEEWGCRQPFQFFCDFEPSLNERVREGRRAEFAQFFEAAESIPDPTALDTFRQCLLRWPDRETPPHSEWLEFHAKLLELRKEYIVPRLAGARSLDWSVGGPRRRFIRVRWRLGDASILALVANMDAEAAPGDPGDNQGQLLFATGTARGPADDPAALPPWFVAWRLAASAET
jgi:malto-oligosyltrehalose trehalohydrolase